MLNLPN